MLKRSRGEGLKDITERPQVNGQFEEKKSLTKCERKECCCVNTVAWGTITPLENCHGCQIESIRLQSMTPELTRVHPDVITPT